MLKPCGGDTEGHVIFAHPSVQRYLISDLLRESGSPASQFAVSPTDSHTLITESCFRYIQYLGYPPDPYGFVKSNHSESPLCKYAVYYWSSHYVSIRLGSIRSHTEKLVLEFVHQYYRDWTQYPGYGVRFFSNLNELYKETKKWKVLEEAWKFIAERHYKNHFRQPDHESSTALQELAIFCQPIIGSRKLSLDLTFPNGYYLLIAAQEKVLPRNSE